MSKSTTSTADIFLGQFASDFTVVERAVRYEDFEKAITTKVVSLAPGDILLVRMPETTPANQYPRIIDLFQRILLRLGRADVVPLAVPYSMDVMTVGRDELNAFLLRRVRTLQEELNRLKGVSGEPAAPAPLKPAS